MSSQDGSNDTGYSDHVFTRPYNREDRSYNRGSYNDVGGYDGSGGYNTRNGYNDRSTYYASGGYNGRGGYNDRSSYSDRGGYSANIVLTDGDYHDRTTGSNDRNGGSSNRYTDHSDMNGGYSNGRRDYNDRNNDKNSRYSGRGRIRGRGRGGPVPHEGLTGKEIGLFYAKRNRGRRKKAELSQRPIVCLSPHRQSRILDLLEIVRGETFQLHEDERDVSEYHHIEDSAFKRKFLQNLKNNDDSTFGEETTECITNQIQRDPLLDNNLKLRLGDMETNSRYQQLLQFRKKLPAYERRSEIIDLIDKNQVIVISGETGCGKTTQVAQFILDTYIEEGNGSLCHIVCTQPRRISAISVAERVADERDEPCGGRSVGYQIRLENKQPNERGSILYCTTGILLQYMITDRLLLSYSHIILDEIHERDTLSDFLITLLKYIVPQRPDLKVILMSATLNADQFASYFGDCPSYNIPGFTFPVKEYYLEDVLEMTKYTFPEQTHQRGGYKGGRGKRRKEQNEFDNFITPFVEQLKAEGGFSPQTLESLTNPASENLNLDLIACLVKHISRQDEEGAILVFLPGWDNISTLHKKIEDDMFYTPDKFIVIPLHSMMPTVNQREVFDRPPVGVRKIVIATNIAETSITIDDIVFVVDCGKIKMKNFDEINNVSTLKAEWVSLANARQRRGRSGRVKPGVCYHLFSKARLNELAEYVVPEMLRTRLEEVVLQVKLLQLGRAATFLKNVMEPPTTRSLALAIQILEQIGALDENERLTPLGFHLAHLPLDPQTAKMILMAAMFGCLDPILSVAASLGFKSPFFIPLGKEREADQKRNQLAGDCKSDHIVLIKALEGYENACTRDKQNEFCYKYFLSSNTLHLLQNMKKQFAEHLHKMHFLVSDDPKDPKANQNTDDIGLVKAIICAGLYPNVAKIRIKKRRHRPQISISTSTDRRCMFHPKSVLSKEIKFPSPYAVYHLKLKSTAIFLHDGTVISPFPLLFFGATPRAVCDDGGYAIEVDSVIKFGCDQETTAIVQELRALLDKLMEYKVSHPGVTNWSIQTREGALLNAIVEVISTEETTLSALAETTDDSDSDFRSNASNYSDT